MKIQGEQYDKIKAAMAVVLPSCRDKRPWAVFNAACDQLRNDDRHPWFMSGKWKRLHPHDPIFDQYADGANDSHIQTVIVRIMAELSGISGSLAG